MEFVSSDKIYKNFYEHNIVDEKFLRYYQISMYPNSDGRHAIRSILFKGIKNNGISFYDYHIMNEKIYYLDKDKLDHFISSVNDQQFKNKKELSVIQIMYKFYPVVDIKLQEYPLGDELQQCTSSLLL